jgi:hypothetical protein
VSNGTTTPSISLSIVPAADGGLGLNTSSSSGYPYVASGTWSVITAATLASNIGALTSANVSGSTNYVAKFTGSNTIGNGIMYDNGSSISISNTNALAPLDVLASGGRDILLGGGSTTNSEIKFLGSNYFSIYNTGSYLTIAQTNALSQTNTAGSPLMSISSGGNVGIGTTSPGFLLDVETSAVTQAKFGSGLPVYIIANSPMVGFNTYWNGGYTYGTSGAAGILTFSQEVSGGFSFNTAASGSSGSSASMTSRLAITNTGNVGVGTTSPAGILDVTSTTSGFLPPRMTDAQRLAISSPVSGMEIFNTTSGCLNYYSSGNWYGVCGTSLLPSQCTSFTVLNDNTRATSYSGGSGCDNSLASGWYRVEGSYSQIPTSPPSPNECNTQATGWLNISIPSVGSTNSGSACWSWTSSTCQWSTSGCQITNCNGYYVYYLNPVTWGCNGRYCVQ